MEGNMNAATDNIPRLLRIYSRGRKIEVGRHGDGYPSHEYRARFIQHIIAGVLEDKHNREAALVDAGAQA
jgi:hypothetical protein